MVDAVTWWSAFTSRYGPTVIGLAIGTAAKYGLTLTEGRRLSARGVVGDLLLLGLLGLLAIEIADWFKLTGDMRVLAGALAAVSSDRLVRLARDRFMRRMESELSGAIRATDAVARVKAGHTPASAAKLMVFRNRDPKTAGIERLAEDLMPQASRADFEQLLRDADATSTD